MNAPGDEPGSRLRAALFLVAGLLICLAFFNSPGTGDRAFWLSWMNGARHAGIFAAYTSFAGQIDYPPLSVVLLGCGRISLDALAGSIFRRRPSDTGGARPVGGRF